MSDRWTLPAALGIGGAELVAFVGGGGKTSLMFALAAALPGRVVITTTTRIFAAQMRHAAAVVYADDLSPLGRLLEAHGRVLVVGHVEGDKAHGVAPDLPGRLLDRPDVDFVLVEADGSRMRPAKAPADHEPVIPPQTTLVVPVAGLDALEGPLDRVVHRPERVRAIAGAGLDSDDRLTAGGLARLLAHPLGGLKGAPDTARVVPVLNKVEGEARRTAAEETARQLLGQARVARVVLAAAHAPAPVRAVWRRVAAVVLAAGESRRMGTNKLLLPWGETTVLAQTLANAAAAGVADVLLVTGHERERVAAAARDAVGFDLATGDVGNGRGEAAAPAGNATDAGGKRRIALAHNSNYANGMLSSAQTAVRHLPPTTDAALFLLGDQPMVTPDLLDRLLRAYAASPAGLVAPYHNGRRGNPVLIDRRYFEELLALPAEGAPRLLLARHTDDLLAVAVDSAAVLHDLDRPEEYERWRPRRASS